jgi:hypothetical protein
VVHSADAPPQPNTTNKPPIASITSLSPSSIAAGAADTQFIVTGTNLDQTSALYLLDKSGNWIQTATKTVNSTQSTILISAGFLASPTFLRVSTAPDAQFSQSIQVYSPSIARAIADPNFTISVLPDDIGTGGSLTVAGHGFTPGMLVVLGRGSIAGVPLSTQFVSDSNLQADVPSYIPGNDLFVAVLSPDGQTISVPVAVLSSYPSREDDVSQGTSAQGQTAPSKVDLSAVSGNIVWNAQNQVLTLQGPGLVPGLQVNFATPSGTFPSSTQASQSPSSGSLPQVDVPVPDAVSKHPKFNFRVDVFAPSLGAVPVASGAKYQWIFDIFRVPLGGLGHFTPYYDPSNNTLEVIQAGIWRPANVVLPALQKLDNATNFVTWTLLANPEFFTDVDNLNIARLYMETVPGNATADLYLRGARIKAEITQLTQIQLSATVTTPKGILNLKRSFPVEVVKGNIGGASYDDIILNTADRTGIPPQYVKAQGILETHYGDPDPNKYRNYRYEPMTVDFKNVTSELRNPADSGIFYIDDTDVAKYIIGGSALTTTPKSTPLTVVGDAQTLGPQFSLGGKVMAFNGLAAGGPRTTASITSADGKSTQPLQIAHSDTWWHKGGPHGNSRNPAPTFYGKAEPPNGRGPNGQLGTNDFSVDYVNGTITLGRQLLPGETLNVRYYPVTTNTVPLVGGTFSSQINLNDRSIVKPDFSSYTFSPPEFLGGWLEKRLTDFPYGNNLTGTISERALQFRASSCPLSQANADSKFPLNKLHCQPSSIVDGRFAGVTAQYVAAASWGPIQVVTTGLGDKNFKKPLLSVLNGQPMFHVLSDDQMGFDLGAVFSLANLQFQVRPSGAFCLPSCKTADWKTMWNNMFYFYNTFEPKYQNNPNQIIQTGDQYEPK